MNQSNPENRLSNFEEFWPYYVREHSHVVNRLLHFVGSTLGLACLVSVFVTGNWWFVPFGLIFGYGFAWIGHFFIEMNKPASFKYPLWSFCADWKMWALMLTFQMESEVRSAVERA